MKNRKLLIAVFLCFAMLVTGIGYAALSGHLTVRGTATYNKSASQTGFIENIVFSDPLVVQSGSAASASLKDEASASAQIAIFNVRTLAVQHEQAIFTYKLTNKNLVDAVITVNAVHETGDTNPSSTLTDFEIIEVSVQALEGENVIGEKVEMQNPNTSPAPTFTLEAGQSATVKVVIDLKETPESDIIVPETYFLHLTATQVDE